MSELLHSINPVVARRGNLLTPERSMVFCDRGRLDLVRRSQHGTISYHLEMFARTEEWLVSLPLTGFQFVNWETKRSRNSRSLKEVLTIEMREPVDQEILYLERFVVKFEPNPAFAATLRGILVSIEAARQERTWMELR